MIHEVVVGTTIWDFVGSGVENCTLAATDVFRRGESSSDSKGREYSVD